MKKAYLLLGSNMEGPSQQITTAVHLIAAHIGEVKKLSSHYKTAAWGLTNQADFINMALLCETTLDAGTIMNKILMIESLMGRERTIKNAPRIIDIDILFFHDEVWQESDLQIPHPAFTDRRFAIIPMLEIAPELQHPVTRQTMAIILEQCSDDLAVEKI